MVEAEFKSVLGGPKGHALSAESFSTVLPDEVMASHVWLFKFIILPWVAGTYCFHSTYPVRLPFPMNTSAPL